MSDDKAAVIEAIGRMADSVDNHLNALQLRVDWQIHKQALTEALTDWKAGLRKAYIELSGEDPWSTHP